MAAIQHNHHPQDPQDPQDQDQRFCANCPREAFSDAIVRDGIEIRLCPSCWCWATIDEPLPPVAITEPCEWCLSPDHLRVFTQPDGLQYSLCGQCWRTADESEDYCGVCGPDCVMTCECDAPQMECGSSRCTHCRLRIRIEEDHRDAYAWRGIGAGAPDDSEP